MADGAFDPELRQFIKTEAYTLDRETRRERMAAAQRAQAEREKERQRTESEQRSVIDRWLGVYRLSVVAVREKDCPRCPSMNSSVALACTYRFDPDVQHHGVDAKPLCRWSGMRHYAMRRNERMITAGISNREMRDVLSNALTIEEALPVDRVANPGHLEAPRRAAQAADRYLQTGVRSLFLYGRKGTWKTWALGWVVAGSREPSLWLPMSKIAPSEEWNRIQRKAIEVSLLAINDLGTEHASDWQRTQLTQILSERDDGARRTAVTSNILFTAQEARDARARRWEREKHNASGRHVPEPPLPDSVEALYGDRVANRLASKAGGAIIECIIGPSLRDVMTEARSS